MQEELSKAEEEQANLKAQAALTQLRLERAGKLTSALEDEGERWNQTVAQITKDIELVVGDVFVAAACISYFGAFTGPYRSTAFHLTQLT